MLLGQTQWSLFVPVMFDHLAGCEMLISRALCSSSVSIDVRINTNTYLIENCGLNVKGRIYLFFTKGMAIESFPHPPNSSRKKKFYSERSEWF